MTNFEKISEELKRAKTKHPVFCKEILSKRASLKEIRETLKSCRDEIDEGNATSDIILMEELCEAYEAYKMKNYDSCLTELAKCGAVIVRMMEWVQSEMEEVK